MLNFELQTWEHLKRRKSLSSTVSAILTLTEIVLCVIGLVKISSKGDAVVYDFFSGCMLIGISFIFGMAGMAFLNKEAITEAKGRLVLKAYSFVRREPCSDGTVAYLNDLLAEAHRKGDRFSERMSISLLLSEVYAMRGELNNALNVLLSQDKTFFREHPQLVLNYYSDLMSCYFMAGDKQSIIAVYNDAFTYMDRTCEKNFVLHMTCCGMQANYLYAIGNARAALELRLRIISMLRSEAQIKGNPEMNAKCVFRVIFGINLIHAARISAEMGDNASARNFASEGRAFTAPYSAYYTAMADDIIRTAV